MVESIDDPEHITTNDRTNSDRDLLETAKWTRYLPEAFGIRESVRGSSYRWCVREGGMWGIATATAMSLHRLRAGSKPLIAGHSFFGTFMVVMLPSYYFCYRRREHHEQVIEMMMKYNQFGHAKTDLPAEPPIDEHPFWEQQQQQQQNNDIIVPKHDREFRGLIKERKEWQKPSKDPSFEEIFQEKK
mmetsp:Transcript_9607/g.11153  ORF Transcript_9607/g.11153 Transcript_9607/m.11153 type:complete len:187 (+) Transcript_9607:88-648(+)|eukprot:CAMPEP_0170930406 /NCGR_PEP_ID=MMETSP0735-20130129/15465_1 /TAXON_ID=186038 /ORGANISM="Fragilariopsis kerguelensis, Strain L26-C5" /LENGTH=186 /DNA_ID=CAMNT_0011331881 /DNA_START=41 /DNA_END=601 /DNA_ORIENTATION=-